MTQAALRTDRLLLEPLADAHREFEVELDGDAAVMRYLEPRPRTRAEVLARHVQRLAVAERAPGLGFWVGSVDGEPVGWWLLDVPERPDQGPAEGQAELGYRLLPRWWRRGLATEGARELVRHAFADLGLQRVSAETMAVNAGSRAVLAAVGLQHVRTFHLQWETALPGAEHGEVEYALTREAWLTG
ncbi:GNAT family N-acetyltransferase [Modestobacter sp. VKM Ac-2986]|uniref:GNAT family N-acetyltransferase n=1 Tax=Modestobacter sp. VKM Ac-2986 TaxID=3004140 RepID=UPI0022AAB3F7|nr:GNAT family N-acetyltransferase [Modestobacter sp. VKM Ac-2986]MCZ2828124.1 GNAT family N-acetyltransferase [Modestobacter sp. VKM Ac-2986]